MQLLPDAPTTLAPALPPDADYTVSAVRPAR
jgi:hypothetical protein